MPTVSNVLIAFGLTLFAGLATGVGSALAFFAKRTNTRFLSSALGFSAGVMIYVSMIEIFVKARDALTAAVGEPRGYWYTTLAFFAGMLLIALIDKLVPSFENPHETHEVEEMRSTDAALAGVQATMEEEASGRAVAPTDVKGALMRMGLLSALAIAIHNFPEGLATFTGALQDPALGLSIAVAIAIHNVPEGIAVSIPLYYATGSKRRAFLWSFLSGLSEPIGALVGYLLLSTFFNDMVFGLLFASVGGIMVYISLDQLLPTAEKYGEHHLAIYGLVAGMAVMALSLLLFA
jgi:ZIP family zinc transporter